MKTSESSTAIDTSSEQYRHECEAREIMHLATIDARRARLAGIELKRGKPERQRLEDSIRRLWPERDPTKIKHP